jgi:hypothetical protein
MRTANNRRSEKWEADRIGVTLGRSATVDTARLATHSHGVGVDRMPRRAAGNLPNKPILTPHPSRAMMAIQPKLLKNKSL